MAFPTSLRALNSRNYRLFFTGQSFSLLGNWMTLTTSAWLIYELSRDPFLVGFLPFANQIPVLLLAPLGGLLGDRLPRIRLMWWLNILCALQAATLATLTLFDAITVGRLLALVTFRGLINALEFPTRQSFIVELVDRKDDLPNAIALNSSMFNAARLVGPGIAGLTIATAGPGVSYLLDASSYLAILSALFLIRPPAHHRPAAQRKRLLTELREGVGYARRSPALMPSLVMVPLIALVGFAASTLAPVFARDLFHGDSTTLGYMFSAVGAGALVSAVTLARQPSPQGLPRLVAAGAFAIAIGQIGVAFSPTLPWALLCLAATGWGTVLSMAGNNTLVQSAVADDKRSRIMGLFAMGQGMFPIGSLIAGGIASSLGPRPAVALAGVSSAAVGWFFLRQRRSVASRIRPPHQPAPLPSDSQT
ncbi:MFS transporter [Actomonas aquatica]|uniref:MFS transporter n=1 Tax=Actomonas aquatica TaxID=2866162 RepID=A0ABZ1CDP7_9BACT|nr:MFS transporter [Opitutus sp. WL0086]WRQ89802.1 MFS transporter [Opitutus sp. WL0086]